MLSDLSCMKRALALARRGSGCTHPNPMVGAVVVKNGQIVSSGWHHKSGGDHAEVDALKKAGSEAKGSTLFVTLEPCSHYGKTPPCTKAIIDSGVKRLVYAMPDPNPDVKGHGSEELAQAGVTVEKGLLEEASEELNLSWSHWVKTKRPLVVLKMAVSMDCKIAPARGASAWISSEISRAQVQRMRRQYDAVLVGANTVEVDNPSLTNRTGQGAQPLRVIVDSDLHLYKGANVFKPLDIEQFGPSPVSLLVTSEAASFERRKEFELSGVDVQVFDDGKGRVDLNATIRMLGEKGIQGVLCEGGAKLATSLLEQGLVDRLILYQGSMIYGSRGVDLFTDTESAGISLQKGFKLVDARKIGPDARLVYDQLGIR